MKSIKKTIRNWKQYGKLSDLGEIARRKFFNNCFDGCLTVAGIISGIFIIFLGSTSIQFTPQNVLLTGFATSIAIGISGLWGAYLSEEAERTKKVIDIKREMAIIDDDSNEEEKKDKKKKKKK